MWLKRALVETLQGSGKLCMICKKVTEQTGGLLTLKINAMGNLGTVIIGNDAVRYRVLIDTGAETLIMHRRVIDYKE